MMDFLNDWGLTLAVFTPAVGAALVVICPKANELAQKAIALGATLLTMLWGVLLLVNFNFDSGGMQYAVDRSWIDLFNSGYKLGIDGISLPLMLMTMFITIVSVIYSWDHFPHPHNPKAFLSLILVLEVGMIGTFVAQDLILFFVFFEVVLVPMYFLIGVWGGPNRQYASIKFFLFTLFGSALMLVSFIAVYFLSGAETFGIQELTELAANGDLGIAKGTALVIFGGMFLGFAIKVPMFPLHTWLPDAHTEAPTVGSVILAAVLLKLGTYGFVRIALPILPEAAVEWAPWIGLLAVIGIIYGALCCLAQKDMKRVIAFSSVAHMGFTMLGIASLTDFGINAAIFGMVAHGLITGLLFFCAGSIQERYETRDMGRLGGVLTQAPHLGWILGVAVMASLGLPGLAGFWGEFPAILSVYEPGANMSLTVFRTFMVIAAIGTVLAAGYLLWMYQRVAFGSPKGEFAEAHVHDLHLPEWIAWVPMLVLIVGLGVFPNLIFKTTDTSVETLVNPIFAQSTLPGGQEAAR